MRRRRKRIHRDLESAPRNGSLAEVLGRVPRTDNKVVRATLRRSFGTRWSSKVQAVELKLLMRHESVETTLRYYVGHDADDIAARLWATA